MKTGKTVGAAVAAMVVTLAAGACSSGGSTAVGRSSQSYRVAYAELTNQGGTFALVNQGVLDAVSVLKYDLKPYDNNFDVTAALQNAQLIAASTPDLVIDESPSESIGASLARTIGSTPCIAMVITIPGCSMFQLPSNKMAQSLADLVAPEMRSRGWDASNTTVILLQNSSAGPNVNYFPHQFYTDLAGEVPGLSAPPSGGITPQTTRIGANGLQVDSKGTLEGGYQAVSATLQAIPASRHLVIVGVEDDPVLGAERAITDSGRGTNTMLAGYGGSIEALTQLRTNPVWFAEADAAPEAWGEYLFAMVAAMRSGTKPPPITYAPGWIVTKTTVSKYFQIGSSTPSVLPPLVPEDQYLAKTGVLQQFPNSPVHGPGR